MDQDKSVILEDLIRRVKTPVRNVPLSLVIEVLSGHKIIPFDSKDNKDSILLQKLVTACRIAERKINSRGIQRARSNEVGNDIELFVKKALKDVGYMADAPVTKSGTKKSVGYPDLEFVDEFGRTSYLECKTYNIANVGTTMRSFYLSPSEDFKVTHDAHHFLVSFEIYREGIQDGKTVYKCKSWKIVSLDRLQVSVKYEFNSDNLRLYSKDLLPAEGKP